LDPFFFIGALAEHGNDNADLYAWRPVARKGMTVGVA
jgi:hypothetical protein